MTSKRVARVCRHQLSFLLYTTITIIIVIVVILSSAKEVMPKMLYTYSTT